MITHLKVYSVRKEGWTWFYGAVYESGKNVGHVHDSNIRFKFAEIHQESYENKLNWSNCKIKIFNMVISENRFYSC